MPCELGDRRLAAGAISQTVWDNCQALGFDTSDAGEYGFAWQSYHEYYAEGDLAPEESTNFAIGIVMQDVLIDGLQASVDYWSIEIDDVIALPIANLILQDCLSTPGLDPANWPTSGSCSLFLDYGLSNPLSYYG